MLIYCIKDYGDFKVGDSVWCVGEQKIYWESRWDYDDCYVIYGEVDNWGDPMLEYLDKSYFVDFCGWREFKIDQLC